jgi:hypothetical protein
LALSKKNFEKIFFQEFRQIGLEIQNNALKRRERIRKRYKEALAYCLNEAQKPTDSAAQSKSLTDSNLSTASAPLVTAIDNKFARSVEGEDKNSKRKNPFAKFIEIANKVKNQEKTVFGSDTEAKAPETRLEEKKTSFRVETLADVVRTPKRRPSFQHASQSELINTPKAHNSDNEGKNFSPGKKPTLSGFSSYANQLKNEGGEVESSGNEIKQANEVSVSEFEDEKANKKQNGSGWKKLNGSLGSLTNLNKKLEKPGSSKNLLKLGLSSDLKPPSLLKNTNANRFVSLLDMKVKRNKKAGPDVIFLYFI